MSSVIAPCVLALALGADALGEAARKELQALEGEWIVQQIETRDAQLKPGEDERMTLTIKGTKWTFGTQEEGEVVALDPSAKPKLLDLKSVRKGREDRINEAIYKVDGDTLVLCIYQGKDKKRPTRFDKPTEADTVLWTLKRSKK